MLHRSCCRRRRRSTREARCEVRGSWLKIIALRSHRRLRDLANITGDRDDLTGAALAQALIDIKLNLQTARNVAVANRSQSPSWFCPKRRRDSFPVMADEIVVTSCSSLSRWQDLQRKPDHSVADSASSGNELPRRDLAAAIFIVVVLLRRW